MSVGPGYGRGVIEDQPAAPNRVQRLFGAALARDGAGGSWLARLLAATPYARERLGALVDAPGWLVTPLAVRTATGRPGAFGYQSAPSRELLSWYVDHPEAIVWPDGAELRPETVVLRRALLLDDPPGAQAKAQERARELIMTRPPFASAWWLLEGMADVDCVLISDRVVVTIDAVEGPQASPVTPWYPPRSRLVRALEAARGLAEHRRWASIMISPQPLAEGSDEALARSLAAAAPHLSHEQRDELHRAYLGNITWAQADAAVGVDSAPAG